MSRIDLVPTQICQNTKLAAVIKTDIDLCQNVTRTETELGSISVSKGQTITTRDFNTMSPLVVPYRDSRSGGGPTVPVEKRKGSI